MTRRTSSRAWFESLGRRHEATGVSYIAHRPAMNAWPLWARRAYCAGRLKESPSLARRQSTPSDSSSAAASLSIASPRAPSC